VHRNCVPIISTLLKEVTLSADGSLKRMMTDLAATQRMSGFRGGLNWWAQHFNL
jgi:hypothetical protein